MGIEERVDELLVCLEADVQRIGRSLLQLNELRTLVIKRDDVALGKLLESIQAGSDRDKTQESQRQSIRRELASALGCNVEQMTLSVLEKNLSKTKTDQVSRMKAKLKSLVRELRKDYLSTVLLICECSRLNDVVLRSIFNLGTTADVYYNANGVTRRHTSTTFMNLQF